MGLSCSGDEYNRRADVAFAAVSNTVRVVDDLLRFDRTFPEHVRGVCEVLQVARDAGTIFSKDKFRLAHDRLSWVGYEIKHGGVTIEEAKLKAQSQFPRPTIFRNYDHSWAWWSNSLDFRRRWQRRRNPFDLFSAPTTRTCERRTMTGHLPPLTLYLPSGQKKLTAFQ
jgi:hypothetical protein